MEDIYPKVKDSFLGSRIDILETWQKEAYEDYKNLFSTQEEFIEYLKKLLPTYRELLLGVSRFYGSIYNSLTQLPESLKHLRDPFELIMMFSIIEKLQSVNKTYTSINIWLESKACKSVLKDLAKKIEAEKVNISDVGKELKNKYYESGGSGNAIADFFSTYFSSEEQKKLVRSYHERTPCVERLLSNIIRSLPNFQENMSPQQVATLTKRTVKEAFLPICYNIDCYIDYGTCHPNYKCILNDQAKLKEYVSRVTKHLVVQYRNRFVHKASIFTFAEPKIDNAHFFHYSVFDKVKGKFIQHQLKRELLHNAFQKAFKLFFDNKTKITL